MKNSIRLFTGSNRLKPKNERNPLSPLVPPVVVCWPISRIAKAAANAWDKIAKYAPRTRLRKIAAPRPKATSEGIKTTPSRVTTGDRNGSHQMGRRPDP